MILGLTLKSYIVFRYHQLNKAHHIIHKRNFYIDRFSLAVNLLAIWFVERRERGTLSRVRQRDFILDFYSPQDNIPFERFFLMDDVMCFVY